MPDQLYLLVATATPVLLAIIIYFTRPGLRRLIAGLSGGIVFMAFNIVGDIVGYYAGWWHYLFTTDTHAPLLIYLGDLIYGTGGALIGWRIQRRFGIPGLLLFVVFLCVYGLLRDIGYATFTHLFAYGPDVMPLIADLLTWATLYLLALSTMRLIAGPANADRLASRPVPFRKQAK